MMSGKICKIIIFFILSAVFAGCRSHNAESRKADFNSEFQEIFSQQYPLRKQKYLLELQQEYSKASTLSNINSLELLLQNPDLSEAEKNLMIMKNFDRAVLYMQIMLFPQQRDDFLKTQIKNELIYETASIFLNAALCELYMLKNIETPPDDNQTAFHNKLKNIYENQKVEYTSLRINDVSSNISLPAINYPFNSKEIFASADGVRKLKDTEIKHDSSAWIYDSLNREYGEKFPLLLLKLLFRAPHELHLFNDNDRELKKDFAALLLDMVWHWQSNQLFSNMKNAFTIAADFDITGKSTPELTPQILQSSFESVLNRELSYLKMLSSAGHSPFDILPDNQDTGRYLTPARLETLNLLIKELLKKI